MSMSNNTNISTHFTIKEAVFSSKAVLLGIPNIPNAEQIEVIEKTAQCMERVRAALDNKPINITSWFRNQKVNTAIGSKPTSQHTRGEAVDFRCADFGTPLEICRKLISLQDLIRFDQLILESSWVHVSFSIINRNPRGQVLTSLSNGTYASGLTDRKGRKL